MENKTMIAILGLRRNIQKLCQKYSKILKVFFKLILGLLLFTTINQMYDKSGGTVLFMAVALAVICSGLPFKYTYLVSVTLTVIYLYPIAWDLVIFYLALVLLSYLIVCRMKPEISVIIAFTPIFFCYKIPLLLPLLIGMFSNMFGVGAMVFGILFYYFSYYVGDVNLLLNAATGGENIIAVKSVMDAFGTDQKFLLLMATFIVVAVFTYIIYHQSFDFAWYIAILAGGVAGSFIYLAGSIVFDIPTRNIEYVVSILGAMFLAAVIQFFSCIIDYGSVEYIEFEDDEYYYYVKAVPKVTVVGEDFTSTGKAVQERAVRRFTQETDK